MHRPGTYDELAARLAVAADVPEVVSPLAVAQPGVSPYLAVVGDRPVSLWPYGRPVCPDDGVVPWVPAARLLARLHTWPLCPKVPVMGGYTRVVRALQRLEACAGVDAAKVAVVRAAAAGLPRWLLGAEAPPGRPSLVHGDWHFGQLADVEGHWQLIDLDDLGAGPAVWDLARPAAWAATGLAPMDDWYAFLAAYHAAGGDGLPSHADPWPVVDAPARAIVVQTAARALVASATEDRPLDQDEQLLFDACRRMPS